jgi:serine/threonine protein phosphatase 1
MLLPINKQDIIWIVGDVHGSYNKLVKLINALPKDAIIYFTGDLIDRGKDSLKVVDLIIDRGYSSVFGNHEWLMKYTLVDNGNYDDWLINGGNQTVKSYKNYPDSKLEEHLNFLTKLPYFLYYELEGCKPLVVSHSYIHDIWKGKDYEYNTKELNSMIWRHLYDRSILNKFKQKEIKNNIYNIFGHTIVEESVITKHYAMVDTGVYKEYGKLSAICYPTLEVVEV